jgi:hypothetical protein
MPLGGGLGGGQPGHQALDLGQGQREEAGSGGLDGTFGRCDGSQERVREHGQGGPPVPRRPGTDLVLIQPAQALAGLERFLDRPAPSGDLDQGL